jgi:hypothetical protein
MVPERYRRCERLAMLAPPYVGRGVTPAAKEEPPCPLFAMAEAMALAIARREAEPSL